MTYNKAIAELYELSQSLAYYGSIGSLFNWDQHTALPDSGMEYRLKLQGFIVTQSKALIASDSAKELYEYFKDSAEEIENYVERGMVREFLLRYKKSISVPVELSRKKISLIGRSHKIWEQSRIANDFNVIKPCVDELLALIREEKSYSDPGRSAFDALVEDTDRGSSVESVSKEFEKLKKALLPLLQEIEQSEVCHQADDSLLIKGYSEPELKSFIQYVLGKIGYSEKNGAFGKTHHPFANLGGPKDARIMLNFYNYKSSIFGAIHELGHAFYGSRGNAEVDRASLWGGIGGSFHESQSRFYENFVGRSREFWEFFYPEAKKRFPQLTQMPFEDYYLAINKVFRSLKRISADEVSYSLHPIIRFEIEKELFAGNIETAELPKAWDDKYEEYLGLRPKDHAEGVLQDVHWPTGLFGYFQSYTLGNLYGAQLRHQMLKEVPHCFAEISGGNFDPLNTWLTETIHQYSRAYTPGEIMLAVTGEELNSDYFIAYLNEKYGKLYKIQ